MKTQRSKQSRTAGSVLLVTMCILGVAAISIGSYLLMVQNQTSSVARSQTWNTVIPISEAGLEEGLAMVNLGAPDIIQDRWAWMNSATASGWTFSGGQFTVTRTLAGSGTYTVTIDTNGGVSPIITSTAVVPDYSVPWIFSSQPQPFVAAIGMQPFLAQVSQNSPSANVGRKVQIQTYPDPLFSAAIITKSNFNMHGNNCTVDSFNSSDPLHSTILGQYSAALRNYNGSVGTDSSVVDDINVGNGNILGKVMTGPGTAQTAVQVGANGSVGGAGWAGPGIQPGYWSGDFNVNIPDVSAPATGITTLPAKDANGIVNLNAGTYTIQPNDPNIGYPLNVKGNATVWVQGSYSPGNGISTTNNSKLTLYVGKTSGSSDTLSISGNGTVNSPGFAANLQFYGLPTLTSIAFSGNAGFIATIYAPEAALTGNGGGNNNLDTMGAMIVNSVTLNGHWNFHYDEALKNNGPTRGWIAKNWSEKKYP